MSSKVVPPPDRFGVRRTGAPERLTPAIAVPPAPDTEVLPGTQIPAVPAPPMPASGG